MNRDSDYDSDIDIGDNQTCSTYFSAVLQAPRIANQYCPNCNEKAENRLCSKCRDKYVCYNCAPDGVCSDCIIMCAICCTNATRGDFLIMICESCEEQIANLTGEIIDDEGLPYKNLIELINMEVGGEIILTEEIEEEISEYLSSQGVYVKYCENG